MHFLGANVKAATPPASALMSGHLEQVRKCQAPPLLSPTEAQGVQTISRESELLFSFSGKLEIEILTFLTSTFFKHPDTIVHSFNIHNAS